MVFMGNGRAKQGHNTLAEHLIDSALEAVHSVHHAVDGWIEQLLGGFGMKNPDDFSPRLKPGVSWVRTKQETPNALTAPLAPPFLPIAKARGISEDLDEYRKIKRPFPPTARAHPIAHPAPPGTTSRRASAREAAWAWQAVRKLAAKSC